MQIVNNKLEDIVKEFDSNYLKHFKQDLRYTYLCELIRKNLTLKEVYANYFDKDKPTFDWFTNYVICVLKDNLSKNYNISISDWYIEIYKPQLLNTSLSKSDQYRQEIKYKLEHNLTDYENTNIDISKRDMYSIMREFGIEPTIKDTNFKVNHYNWFGIKEIFDKIHTEEWNRARVVRAIRKKLNANVSISTLKYKEREFGNNYKTNYTEYSYYSLLKDMASKMGRNNTLKEYDLIVSEELKDINYLLCNYSISEIAFILDIPLYKTLSLVLEGDSLAKRSIPYLNCGRIPNIYYAENIEEIKEDIKIYPLNYVATKYKISVNYLKKLKSIYNLNYHNPCYDFLEMEFENIHSLNEYYKHILEQPYYSYYGKKIDRIYKGLLYELMNKDKQ